MLLSYLALVERVVEKHILALRNAAGGLDKVDVGDVNSSSIDIHLGHYVLQERQPHQHGVVDFRQREKITMRRIELDPDEGYVLAPGEFILAESAEIFGLPTDLSCEYKLKSSMARIGLEHFNAGWCDAGWNGSVLTLELKNMTNYHSIRIRPGDAIGQMVFFSHVAVPEHRSYAARGRYNGDTTVKTIKE